MRNERVGQLIGNSLVLRELQEEIDRVARSDAKVLVTGESGVGKELVAHAVHTRSPRAGRPFVAVNCAGLPETLLESELFGHVKGSFTGAYRDKPGKLELADHGTIFLDEIGEMTLRMQGLLLRFLETGELQKVGADRVGGRVNVRVIAATNRNLRDMITQGTFREDLFYRLNVIHLVVPPLRERREDIPVLVEHFLTRFAADDRLRGPSDLSRDAIAALMRVLVARQRARARERHRAPRSSPAASERSRSDDLPTEVRAQRGDWHAPEARAAPHRGRRSVQAARSRARIVLDRRSIRSTCSARSRAATCATWSARASKDARGNYKIVARLFNMEPQRLQAVPELPAEARLPAARSRSTGSERWLHGVDDACVICRRSPPRRWLQSSASSAPPHRRRPPSAAASAARPRRRGRAPRCCRPTT